MDIHTNFSEILSYAPVVVGIIVGFNAFMAGLYAFFSKLYTQSLDFPSNKYLLVGSSIAKRGMEVLQMIGFAPMKPVVRQELKRQAKQINLIQKKVRNNGRLRKKPTRNS